MKKLSKFLKSAAILSVLSAGLVACSSEPSNDPSSDGGETGESTGGGDLKVAVMSDPVSLDPHGANENVSNSINSTIYDRLVHMETDLTIQPALAESFEQIDDTTWEAKIRQGVTFHDGSELNAEVVKANLDRVRDSEVASPVSFLFGMITDVTVEDEFTVHIETEFPFASLPAHLAHPGGSIISLESIEASYEAMENGGQPFSTVNEAPAGTGYFKFEERSPGQSVTLVKNEDYWHEEKAKVDSVTFTVIPEDLTRIAELETGGVDIIFPVNPSDVSRVENGAETSVQQSNSTRMVYLGFNTEVEPFDDVNVRRALHMAVDKQALIDGVLDGTGVIADGPIAPDVFGYSDNIDRIEHDPEQAKELLAEAGFPDGFQTTILTDDDRERQDLAQALQYQLAEIGVDIEIDTYEFGTYLERAGQGQSELFLGSWGTVTLDGDYGLYPVFHSANKGPAGNRSFIDNEEIDSLLQQAREATDDQERLDFYEAAQNELAAESPYAYLYFPEIIAGVRDDVEGFWQFPSTTLFLRDVELNR
ncbi:glutathione ABC transporter substrate-binding protein [Alkalihalophilus marmarensis]|uniref:glutathione ABC transporter substrate-binding protein n=1 Tax=Alkalihalophilus marmarensis TaxID=521377 RepID=UPI002DBDB159|nr:glutathione ABC transporter substrate-binding protein [Alkalihalophilus marmarensis]MEC2071922.1 glutathione ABC transporter substrate-binding protein [Alkalihalophilus marmarensis]